MRPFLWGRVGSPSNTVWPGPRPISIPSGILINQPFAHNTPTSQTDRTDSVLIAQGEPFYKRSPKNHKHKLKLNEHLWTQVSKRPHLFSHYCTSATAIHSFGLSPIPVKSAANSYSSHHCGRRQLPLCSPYRYTRHNIRHDYCFYKTSADPGLLRISANCPRTGKKEL